MRTIVYSVKVNTEGAKKGGKDMQITMRTMQSDAGKASDSMKLLGDTIAKEYGATIKVATDNTRTAKAAIRDASNEANRSAKNYKLLANEYDHLASRIGKSADEQEVLNAVFRLGAGATDAQKRNVEQLVRTYQAQRNEINKTQGSFRGMRGQMQNFGYQMQDVAVQVQMGTNAMTIFSQQGSQLAAGFGPTGALIGAGIAFAGMLGSLLIPKVLDAGKNVEELTDKLKELAKASGLTKEQAEVLVAGQRKLIKEYTKEHNELAKKARTMGHLNETYDQYAKRVTDTARITSRANGGMSSSISNIALSEKAWIKEQEKSKLAQTTRIAQMQTLRTKIAESKDAMVLFNSAIGSEGTDKLKKYRDENRKIIEGLQKQLETTVLTKSEILEREKATTLATLADQKAGVEVKSLASDTYDLLIAEAKRIEAEKELAKALALKAKADAEAEKQAKTALAIEKSRMALLASLDIGDTSALRAKYKEESKLLGDNLKAQKALREQYDKDVISAQGTNWEKYLVNLEGQLKSTDEIMINSLDRFTAGFGDAFANAVFESESLGDAMSNIFKDVSRNMVAFFAEWAAQELTMWALKKLIGTATGTSQGIAMTSTAEASSLMASLNAFAATAAIPIVGPLLAPGAAAAALAATQPMVAAISGLSFAGAFDKGGVIPQNSLGIVSEYGDELVNGVLVRGKAGGTRVTGREDTARMMGGNTSNSITINSSGNASPEAIARALTRALKKTNKQLDTAIYDSTNRGGSNRGKRYA